MEKLLGVNRVPVTGTKNIKASYFKPTTPEGKHTLFIFKGTEGGMWEFEHKNDMLGFVLRQDKADFTPSKTAKELRAKYQAEVKGIVQQAPTSAPAPAVAAASAPVATTKQVFTPLKVRKAEKIEILKKAFGDRGFDKAVAMGLIDIG